MLQINVRLLHFEFLNSLLLMYMYVVVVGVVVVVIVVVVVVVLLSYVLEYRTLASTSRDLLE